MKPNFASDALDALADANSLCIAAGQNEIRAEHILIALLISKSQSEVCQLLEPASKAYEASQLLRASALPRQTMKYLSAPIKDHCHEATSTPQALDDAASQICADATELATRWSHNEVTNAHLLLAFLTMRNSVAVHYLDRLGMNTHNLVLQLSVLLKRTSANSSQSKPSAEEKTFPVFDPKIPALTRADSPTQNYIHPAEEDFAKDLSALDATDCEAVAKKEGAEGSYDISFWFEEEALTVIKEARRMAEGKCAAVHPDHLLAAMIRDPDSIIAKVLASFIDLAKLNTSIFENIELGCLPTTDNMFSSDCLSILQTARRLGSSSNQKKVSLEQLFFSLLISVREQQCESALAQIDPVNLPDIRELYDIKKTDNNWRLSRANNSLDADSDCDLSKQKVCNLFFPVTKRVLRILDNAYAEAKATINPQVTNSHLLVAMLSDTEVQDVGHALTRKTVIDELKFAGLCEQSTWNLIRKPKILAEDIKPRFSDELKNTLSQAADEAGRLCNKLVDLNHILLAMMADRNSLFSNALSRHGVPKVALTRRLEWCSAYNRKDETVEKQVTIDLLELETFLIHDGNVYLANVDCDTQQHVKCLSARSQKVFRAACAEAAERSCSEASIEHMALALAKTDSGIVQSLLLDLGIFVADAAWVLTQIDPRGSKRVCSVQRPSTRCNQLLKEAWSQAKQLGAPYVEPEHILLAIAKESHGIAFTACRILGVDGDKLFIELANRMGRLA